MFLFIGINKVEAGVDKEEEEHIQDLLLVHEVIVIGIYLVCRI